MNYIAVKGVVRWTIMIKPEPGKLNNIKSRKINNDKPGESRDVSTNIHKLTKIYIYIL